MCSNSEQGASLQRPRGTVIGKLLIGVAGRFRAVTVEQPVMAAPIIKPAKLAEDRVQADVDNADAAGPGGLILREVDGGPSLRPFHMLTGRAELQ